MILPLQGSRLKPGVSIIRDPALRKLRFLRFVDDKLSGLTHPQIAEKNGVSVNTVDREMSWGKRAGIIVEAEDHLLSTLFPLAKQAIIDALTPRTIFDEKGEVKEVIPGDVGVAMKLYDKVVKGREAKGEGNSLDELTKFIAARRQKAGELEETTEGQLMEPAPMRFITAGEMVKEEEQK